MKKVFKTVLIFTIILSVFVLSCISSFADTYDVSYFNVKAQFRAYFISQDKFVDYYYYQGITLPYDSSSYTIPHLYGYSPYKNGVWVSPYTMYFTTRNLTASKQGAANLNDTSVRKMILNLSFNLSGMSYDISAGSMIIKFDFLIESEGIEDNNGKFIYAFNMDDYFDKCQPVEWIKINNLPILNVDSAYYKIEEKYHTEYPVGSSNGGMESNVYSFTLAFPISEESIKDRYGDTLTNFDIRLNMVGGTVPKDPIYTQFEMLCTPITFEMSDMSIKDLAAQLTKEISDGTEKIIENNNANTDKVINNNNQNTDKIINNQDKNADKISDSVTAGADKVSDSIDNAMEDLTTPTEEGNAIIGRTDDLVNEVDGFLDNGMNTVIVDLGKYAALDPSILPLNEYKELFNLFLNGNLLILFTTVLSIGFVLRLVFGSLPDLFAKAGSRENKRRERDSKGGDS